MDKEAFRPSGARVLYLTYDGLTDPLGRSQVLPYLMRLAELGHEITILSCEKETRLARDRDQVRNLCAAAGIDWHPIAYHKNPPIASTVYDLFRMRQSAVRLHKRKGFNVVHCRSHPTGAVGLHLKESYGVRLLFDARGFWPEEKTESGAWNLENPVYRAVYRYFKRLESRLLRHADEIVFLTEAGKRELLRRPELNGGSDRITVIPCCADFEQFALATAKDRTNARQKLRISNDARVLLYLGSIGAWYLLDEMLDFFREFLSYHGDAQFLFVTPDDASFIRNAAIARGLEPRRLTIVSASREEVPILIAAADVGISFIRPLFSKTGSSPTKVGEMIAVGLPLVANVPVGDVEEIFEETECGIIVRELRPAAYSVAVEQIERLTSTAAQRRKAALPWFDLETGAMRYHQLYARCSASI